MLRSWANAIPTASRGARRLLLVVALCTAVAAPAAAGSLILAGGEQTEWTTDELTYAMSAGAPSGPNVITITREPGTDDFHMSATVVRLTQHDFFEIGPCEGVYTNVYEGDGGFAEIGRRLVFTGTLVASSEYRCDAQPTELVRDEIEMAATISDVGLEGYFEGYEFAMSGVPEPVGGSAAADDLRGDGDGPVEGDDAGAGAGAGVSSGDEGDGGTDVWVLVLVAVVIGGVAVTASVWRRAPRGSGGLSNASADGGTGGPGQPGEDAGDDTGDDDDEHRSVVLELTHPAGASPKVFTEGWLFGARCIVDPGGPGEQDRSAEVRWGGTGSFGPAVGAVSRPRFGAQGVNTIELVAVVDGRTHRRTFTVDAIDPQRHGFVGVGAIAHCPADAHGCPACPHPTKGPIASGSPTVLVGGVPAARVGDGGVAAPCCGPNSYTITSGDASVLIDGRPAAKRGSVTKHCGGLGSLE